MLEPHALLLPFEQALEDVVKNQDPKYLKENQHLSVGFTGRRGRTPAPRPAAQAARSREHFAP